MTMDGEQADFPFPNEILYKITACVISQNVHSIYLSTPESDLTWELEVITTLCSVSRKVRAVTLHLAQLALNVNIGQELHTQLLFATNQLQRLRKIALDSYHALETPYSYEPRGGDGILATGYVLLLFVSVLRVANARDAIQSSSARYINVATTLQKAVKNCQQIPNFGVLDLLLDATQDEIDCTWLGLSIVQLFFSLSQLSSQWDLTTAAIFGQEADAKRTVIFQDIDNTLEKTTAVGKQYHLIQKRTRIAVPVCQLPGASTTIKQLEDRFADVFQIKENLDVVLQLY